MTSAIGLAYGMMAMMPVLFASAGYVLVSAQGSADRKERRPRD
jgi:hypothetical protein